MIVYCSSLRILSVPNVTDVGNLCACEESTNQPMKEIHSTLVSARRGVAAALVPFPHLVPLEGGGPTTQLKRKIKKCGRMHVSMSLLARMQTATNCESYRLSTTRVQSALRSLSPVEAPTFTSASAAAVAITIAVTISPAPVSAAASPPAATGEDPATHLVRGLAPLLREHDLDLPPPHDEAVHLLPRLGCLLVCGELDEGEALGLLGVEVAGNVDISDVPNPPKGAREVALRDLGRYIPDQERDSGRSLVASGGAPSTSSTAVGGRATSVATSTSVRSVRGRTSASVGAVVAAAVVLRRTPPTAVVIVAVGGAIVVAVIVAVITAVSLLHCEG